MDKEPLIIEADSTEGEDIIIESDKMETDDEPEVIKEILSEPTKEKLAELKKTEGNTLYKDHKYSLALPFYSEAIALCPENAMLYSNRAACYLMLNKNREALLDCQEALRRDCSNVKALMREAKCHLLLGDPTAALRSLSTVKSLSPMHKDLPKEIKGAESLQHIITEGDKAYAKQDYRKCVYCMDRALSHSPECSKFKLLRAECLAYLNRLTEAREVSSDIIRFEQSNADAYFVRGLVLYYEDNIDKAFQHFQQVLRLAPDHPKAMKAFKQAKNLRAQKERGNDIFKKSDFEQAYAVYSEALNIDPLNTLTNAKLYFNRAQCSVRLKRLNEAVADCSKAIELDSNYVKAYIRRAKCYQDLDMHEEAVRDFEFVYQQDKSRDNKKHLESAKLELKKSKRKDYYKILGIGKDASEDEIKRAYKKAALKHHPDRHANATETEKLDQEKKFKELNEAYGILSDPKKKTRYDNGYDLEDITNGHGFPSADSEHIHMFFNSGMFSSPFGAQANGFQFQFG